VGANRKHYGVFGVLSLSALVEKGKHSYDKAIYEQLKAPLERSDKPYSLIRASVQALLKNLLESG
jgi:hypothetical protein